MATESVSRLRGPAQPVAPVGIFKPFVLSHVGKPCPYCTKAMDASGMSMATREHMLPRVLIRSRYKGEFRQSLHHLNIIAACYSCNKLKGGRTLIEFLVRPGITKIQKQAVWVLIERLRADHPQDVFIALTGSPR